MNEPSSRYHEALRASTEFHATHKTFNGRFFLRYIDDVRKVIDDFECRTLLDYGCGKGKQWEAILPPENADENWEPHAGSPGMCAADYLGVKVTKYDPAYPPFAAEPQGKFDIVVCTQVLGSIPIIDLPWAVDRLYAFANDAVFVGERLGPVKKLVHAHMRAEMPYEWTRDQWEGVLRRSGGLPCFLKTTDGRSGETITEFSDVNA